MQAVQLRKWGDFGAVASYYHNWPSYSPALLKHLIAFVRAEKTTVVADIGAGTGTLTRMLQAHGLHGYAIEPDEKMRSAGIERCGTNSFEWTAGSAEDTGLPSKSIDWIVMGNAFHWIDSHRSLEEFRRVLRDRATVSLLWVLRDIRRDALLQEIESIIHDAAPNIRRTLDLVLKCMDSVEDCLMAAGFSDCYRLEMPHKEKMSASRFRDAWRTITDVPCQVGEKKWAEILNQIDALTLDEISIEMSMRTYAWTFRAL
ncbi:MULTISPECIES: class I SAM-dependent methyltransferase [unclassified Sinorhizobium]|uniref:class I SAM-dependent methyltransferase n=1 Tax=unclassified Sinorhizobium TaxID=2613772 RepID=UPI0024C4249E|nr:MULTISPECIES: class I SAM-dependent methyltransferase [unclassified Sinorhizobium]MDK1378151.1 class I SAM-dependent methyltransferase [Sinorhizobium sp. 6-70]MDK1479800.1 class I SAM-dependent methyltransferase [Sinorhizobium sp. 6-117]